MAEADDWTWAKENLAPTPVAKRTGKPKSFTPHQLLPSAVKRLKRTSPHAPAAARRVSLGRSPTECGFCGSAASPQCGLVKCQFKSCGVLCETCDAVYHAPPERSGHHRAPVRSGLTERTAVPSRPHIASPTAWAPSNTSTRPLCDNDLCEFATVHCAACAQHFCASCDRVFHLHPSHHRTSVDPSGGPDTTCVTPCASQQASSSVSPVAAANLKQTPCKTAGVIAATWSQPFVSQSPVFRGHFRPAHVWTGLIPSLLARKFRLHATSQVLVEQRPSSVETAQLWKVALDACLRVPVRVQSLLPLYVLL